MLINHVGIEALVHRKQPGQDRTWVDFKFYSLNYQIYESSRMGEINENQNNTRL